MNGLGLIVCMLYAEEVTATVLDLRAMNKRSQIVVLLRSVNLSVLNIWYKGWKACPTRRG